MSERTERTERIANLIDNIWVRYGQESHSDNEAVRNAAYGRLMKDLQDLISAESALGLQADVQAELTKGLTKILGNVLDQAKETVQNSRTLEQGKRQEAIRHLLAAEDSLFNVKLSDHKSVIAMMGSFRALAVVFGALFKVDVSQFVATLDGVAAAEKEKLPKYDTTRAMNVDSNLKPQDYSDPLVADSARNLQVISEMVPTLFGLLSTVQNSTGFNNGQSSPSQSTPNNDIDITAVEKGLTASSSLVLPKGMDTNAFLSVLKGVALSDNDGGRLSAAELITLQSVLIGEFKAKDPSESDASAAQKVQAITDELRKLSTHNAPQSTPVTGAVSAVDMNAVALNWATISGKILIPSGVTAEDLLRQITAFAQSESSGSAQVLSLVEQADLLKSLSATYAARGLNPTDADMRALEALNALRAYPATPNPPQPQALTVKTIDLQAIENAAARDASILKNVHVIPSLTAQELFDMTRRAATMDNNAGDITGNEQRILIENIRDQLVAKGIEPNIAANDAQQFVAGLRQLSP